MGFRLYEFAALRRCWSTFSCDIMRDVREDEDAMRYLELDDDHSINTDKYIKQTLFENKKCHHQISINRKTQY